MSNTKDVTKDAESVHTSASPCSSRGVPLLVVGEGVYGTWNRFDAEASYLRIPQGCVGVLAMGGDVYFLCNWWVGPPAAVRERLARKMERAKALDDRRAVRYVDRLLKDLSELTGQVGL
jgi:hypothetical protein